MAKKCWYCEGTGKYKKPLNKEEFDKEFDRLEDLAIFNTFQCREMALEETGYTIEKCQNCHGTGFVDD